MRNGTKVSIINKGLIGLVVGSKRVSDQFGRPFDLVSVRITLECGDAKTKKESKEVDYVKNFNPAFVVGIDCKV